MTDRIIALIDMDCFYCQVEARENPELQGKPVCVVQYKDYKGGGIIAVNYEARKFGVTRQMRGDDAKLRDWARREFALDFKRISTGCSETRVPRNGPQHKVL